MYPGEACEVEALAELSARLGRDPLLVQAASGNTSIKTGGALWIKASGKRLADACEGSIFTRVDCSCAGRATHDTGADLKPSVETAMHATLPHKVVLHVHSVNAIAWAVRQDGREQVTRKLAGLRWCWIPHALSGEPLAYEISKALDAEPDANVFVLANHGLVVCGESCSKAETLLHDVEERLAITPRRAPDCDLLKLRQAACPERWKLPALKELHALGTDGISRSILAGGVLFPCQAIFLAPSLALLTDLCQISDARQEFAVVKKHGVLLSRTISQATYEMLLGLMEVVQRIDDKAPIRYLTQEEVKEVLDACTY